MLAPWACDDGLKENSVWAMQSLCWSQRCGVLGRVRA